MKKNWKKDYFKSIFFDKIFHKEFTDADEQLKMAVEVEINSVLDSATADNDYSDLGIIVEIGNGTIDAVPIIQSVAEELEISFEECLNNVYGPFYVTKFENELLLNIKYDELNYGETVEYNGSNELEYIDYVLNSMELNRDYLNSLFEHVEIVERS